MRGKPVLRPVGVLLHRITPARAGKTALSLLLPTPLSDHPRACGENCDDCSMTVFTRGSPPRVRGKPPSSPRGTARCRITPARAGKTGGRPARNGEPPDHPRACGENGKTGRKSGWTKGSPPRVRGKLAGREIVAAPVGITPARAGKTDRPAAARYIKEDHPRACGENGFRRHPVRMDRGSPPRVRGKLERIACLALFLGITPARAGKTYDRPFF